MPLIRPDDAPDDTDYRADLQAHADALERRRQHEERMADIVMGGIGWFYAAAGAVLIVYLVRACAGIITGGGT